jgi:hypothetical protein
MIPQGEANYIASKTSSEPLFGSPTPKEVEAIQTHIQAFTAKLVKDADKARELLKDIGAIAPKGR